MIDDRSASAVCTDEYWIADPNEPWQRFGNEYILAPYTEETAKRYGLGPHFPGDERGFYVLLVRRANDVPIENRTGLFRAFYVREEEELREYLAEREQLGWFRRVPRD